MTPRLRGKVAIVTGAGQGIGREIALALAREGCNVVAVDLSEQVSEVAKEAAALGVQALALKADVSKMSEVEQTVKEALKRFQKMDILVNNAGIFPFRSLLEMTEDEWDRVMDVNLKGVFNYTKAVIPSMVKQRYGKIVNIASIAGTTLGYVNLAHYCASKAGVLGFTRAAALELAQYGITVNAVAPGAIETPGAKAVGGGAEALQQFIAAIPLKRIGQPNDIAALVVFLVSDDSSYITGQCIVADGGYTVQ